MSEWKKVRLGDVVEYKKGFALKSSWYEEQGRMIVRVSNTTSNSVDINSCVFINEERARTLNDYKLNFKDVVIATVGSWPNNPNSVVGKVIRIPKEADGAILNQNAVRLSNNDRINKDFLYY